MAHHGSHEQCITAVCKTVLSWRIEVGDAYSTMEFAGHMQPARGNGAGEPRQAQFVVTVQTNSRHLARLLQVADKTPAMPH